MRYSKFFSDLYTGPDQSTFALGRVYSIPVLLMGLFAAAKAIQTTTPVPLGDIALELAGVAGAVAAMVRVTNGIDVPTPTERP